jgi:PucR family transcriptional regulator, purine catabolism regulatory protein
MHRLHDRSRDGQLRRVHHELLIGLLSEPANPETHRRAEIAGLPPSGQYVGLALRPPRAALLDDLVAACLRAAEVARAPTLASVFDDEVRALVALPGRADAVRQTDRWAGQVTSRVAAVVTAGSPVDGLASADRTLLEASQVLAALPPGDRAAGVRRLVDVHLRGLLTLLADDRRVTTFAERELGPLRDEPELLRTLRAVLEHAGGKSAAATALNISRPVLYDRIARLQRILGVSLDEAETRTSLHVALLAEGLRSARG